MKCPGAAWRASSGDDAMKRARQVLIALGCLLALAATFAWYFHGLVVFDLTNWWASCFGP